jgi:predicted amidohydrolase
VGEGGKLRYAGDSALVDPWGETLVEGDASDRVLVADVDPAKVAEARARFPVLEDVRPQAYRR